MTFVAAAAAVDRPGGVVAVAFEAERYSSILASIVTGKHKE
jgi:hypothetical protein